MVAALRGALRRPDRPPHRTSKQKDSGYGGREWTEPGLSETGDSPAEVPNPSAT